LIPWGTDSRILEDGKYEDGKGPSVKWTSGQMGLGTVVHFCNFNYSGGGGRRIRVCRPRPRQKHETLSKISKATGAGGVDQLVECLPCKCMAFSSNPSATKRKKKKV
jgi:hypothetical protein